MATPASVFVVLSLGAAGGGVVKGITGFGNAIINLLVWVTFNAFGVYGGTLKQAVLADTVGCMVAGIPLLIMTKAHRTADWRLVIAILAFTTSGAPVGAALLTRLNPRWVELVMAVVLLLVIALHVKLHEKIAKAVREWREKRRSSTSYGLLEEDKAARRAAAAAAAAGISADGDQLTHAPGSASDAALTGSLGSLADTDLPSAGVSSSDAVYHSLAVDCLPSPMPSRLPSLQAPGALTEALAGGSGSKGNAGGGGDATDAVGGRPASGSGHAGGCCGAEGCRFARSSGCSISGGHAVVTINAYCAPSASDVGAGTSGTSPIKADATGCSTSGDAGTGNDSEREAGAAAVGSGGSAAEATDATSCAMTGLLTISDMAPLLETGAAASDAGASSRCGSSCVACGGMGKAASDSNRCGACGGSGLSGRGAGGAAGGLLARIRRWVATADWREIRRIIAFGSVAGFISGVMGGMTGIGGPPIMFMYEKLQVAKDVVRGTNAVNNVLQPRLVTYIVMGMFAASDAPLYAVTSVVGLGGVALGNALAGRLDQRGFSRVLVGLMLVCCALLFASAAGLKGGAHHAAPAVAAAATGGAGADAADAGAH